MQKSLASSSKSSFDSVAPEEQSTMDRLMRMMYAVLGSVASKSELSEDPRVSEALVEDLNKLTLAKAHGK